MHKLEPRGVGFSILGQLKVFQLVLTRCKMINKMFQDCKALSVKIFLELQN